LNYLPICAAEELSQQANATTSALLQSTAELIVRSVFNIKKAVEEERQSITSIAVLP